MSSNVLRRRPALPFLAVGAAALVLIGISVGVACGGGEEGTSSGGVTGKLSLGEFAEAARASVAEGDATIAVDLPGDPLNGLELKVPAGSYQGSRDFIVSYRPITGHSYGDRINPLSPLIRVENGGGYADEVMTVKVPVQVPEGHFAMGFFYDRDTGALEGMLLAAEEAGSVTVATRHFSDFFVSSVLESTLMDIDVKTGFLPGVDDWQFVNYGSFITEGNCAGQSLSAIWYYYERALKDKSDGTHLWGRYDNNGQSPKTSDFWYDDSRGYRLASVAQKQGWTGSNFIDDVTKLDASERDPLTYLSFAYSMWVTGGPQLMVVWGVEVANSQGKTEEVGHALVAYAVTRGLIWIADPNAPGAGSQDVQVTYRDGKFEKYQGRWVADAPPVEFPIVLYAGVSAYNAWDGMGELWSALEDGTIGDGVFPDYSLDAYDYENSGWLPVVSWSAAENKWVTAPALEVSKPDLVLQLTSSEPLKWSAYRDGEWLPQTAADGGFESVELEPGDNHLGILIAADPEQPGTYVDFRWVDVFFGTGLVIEPAETEGPPGEYSFTARADQPPEQPLYVWDFGDGQAPEENFSTQVSHDFKQPGTYTITVRLHDEVSGKVLAAALAVARIGEATGTPTPSAGPDTGSASSGGWVLKGVEPSKTVQTPGGCYSGYEVTIAGLSGTTYERCSGPGPPGPTYDVYEQTQHSWSAAPPERLAPGEMLRITSTTSVEGTFHTIGLGGGASTWVRIDLVPGGGPYPGAGWASATEENSPASAVSEFSIPSGSEGVLMTVALTFQSGAGSGQTTYTYEWQGP
ncbi:MAG: PKD domain-containing protein [Chloroflexi bacterium]|nr:PKD domain-containing protein [Chloroflexota bacterium]